jgi:hypothetical protein
VSETKVPRAIAFLVLPDSVQARLVEGFLPPATAYEISKVGDEAEQAELADRVVRKKLSRQGSARVVRERKQAGTKSKTRPETTAVRTVEFATQHSRVSVVAADQGVIAAPGDALAQARSGGHATSERNAEAA